MKRTDLEYEMGFSINRMLRRKTATVFTENELGFLATISTHSVVSFLIFKFSEWRISLFTKQQAKGSAVVRSSTCLFDGSVQSICFTVADSNSLSAESQ